MLLMPRFVLMPLFSIVQRDDCDPTVFSSVGFVQREVFITAVDYDGIKAGDENLRVQYMLAYNGDDPVACANDKAIRFGGGGVKVGDTGEGGDNVLPGVTAVTPKNGYI